MLGALLVAVGWVAAVAASGAGDTFVLMAVVGVGEPASDALPSGTQLPDAVSPGIIAQLPAAVHALYLDAFVTALGPVFSVAAAVSLVGFALTWLLREVPLRKSAAAEGIAESFATPRERILAVLVQRENRWRVYEGVAEHAGVDLDPTELWLLGRLGEEAAIDLTDPRLAAAGASLRERGLIEDSRLAGDGQAVYGRVLATRRRRLAELLDGWKPEDHDEVRAMLDDFARQFVAEPPITA